MQKTKMDENKKHEITKLMDDLVYYGAKLEFAETNLERYQQLKANAKDRIAAAEYDYPIESRKQRIADVKLQIETRKAELLHLIEEVSA